LQPGEPPEPSPLAKNSAQAAPEFEYPLLVLEDESPPPDGPLPYVGDNVTGTLEFFRESASEEESERYRAWLQAVEDHRYHRIFALVVSNAESITIDDATSLRPGVWVKDPVLHYVPKSMKSILGLTDPSVHFFTSFFFTKLMNVGNADPKLAGKYCFRGVRGWTKRLLPGKSIEEMKTLIFLYNEGRQHWITFAIFMDLKVIQAFDSCGNSGTEILQSLYHWLHDTMESEGKHLNVKEWRLYGTRLDCPQQNDGFNCGLFATMIGVCLANHLPLSIVKARIKAARTLLLLHLIDLQPDRARPPIEGPIGSNWVGQPKH